MRRRLPSRRRDEPGETATDLAVPFAVRTRPGRCPACGHEAGSSTFRSPLRRRGGPATCRVSDGVDDPSGWPTECGCTDAFHGS